MQARSSVLLKVVCTILFIVFSLTALFSGLCLAMGLSFGAVGYERDMENGRQMMVRAVIDREYRRIRILVHGAISETQDGSLWTGDLDTYYDPNQTNIRLTLSDADGAVLYSSVSENEPLLSEVSYPVANDRRKPVDAEHAGFSGEHLMWFQGEKHFVRPEDAEVCLAKLSLAQEIASHSIYSFVNPYYDSTFASAEDSNDIDLPQLSNDAPTQTESSAALPVDETTAETLYGILYRTAATESNVVSRLFMNSDEAFSFASEVRMAYPDAEISDELVFGTDQHIVTAYLYETSSANLYLTVGLTKALAVRDLDALLIRVINCIVDQQPALWTLLLVSLVLGLVCIVWLCIAAGHKRGVEGIHKTWLDRIPLDLYLMILIFLLSCTVWIWQRLSYASFSSYENPVIGDTLLLLCLSVGVALPVVVWLLLGLSALLTFVTRVKAGKWWRNTIIFLALSMLWKALKWFYRGIRYMAERLPLYWRTLLAWGGLSLFVLLVLTFYVGGMPLVLWFFAELILTPFVIFSAINLRKLQKGGEELAAGNLSYRIDTHHMLPMYRKHAENLNSINVGMQRAVHEQMRSERLKTELITNVSHDIKTPLTSIISYVKLLQRDGLQSEQAPQYLEVLDRQSARLKKLTDDLVEASKASSGALSVTMERTDLHVFLHQVLGEFSEKAMRANLTIVEQFSADAMFVLADGKLLWRVFENLFGNLIKYAQSGTRVYLSTETSGSNAVITLKNVSRDPLNISGNELMERFVRGDASRNTEGSGLGLSIAKSLMTLQNGTVEIEIDGDLFKAIVKLPLAG